MLGTHPDVNELREFLGAVRQTRLFIDLPISTDGRNRRSISPQFVVFSAGNLHNHPRAEVAARYLDHGVPVANIFRTDRGSTRGGTEWLEGHRGHTDAGGDQSGDDDVDIVLPKDGTVQVGYRTP